MQIDGTLSVMEIVGFVTGLLAAIWMGAWFLISLVGKQFTTRVNEKFDALSAQVGSNAELTKESIGALHKQLASDRTATDTKLESLQGQVRSLERDLLTLKGDLPNHYERREDAVRRELAITSRLETLATIMRDRRES
jgi:uncharacterized protein Yka (UPF0111/DUF47 family)